MGRCTNLSILFLDSLTNSRSSCVSTYLTLFLLAMRSVSDSEEAGLRLRELAELELLELLLLDLADPESESEPGWRFNRITKLDHKIAQELI